MAAQAGERQRGPLLEINTTPLIDVMLVLLIMFLVTIPVQTHAVKVDLPTRPVVPVEVHPVKNKIVVLPNRAILWNDAVVDAATLRRYLAAAAALDPEPELHLQPHPMAPYEVVDEVLAMTKRAKVTKMGFVGNEAYRTF